MEGKGMVLVAKRENNTKRNYLVVNKYQGKHIPVNPVKALEMFSALAGLVKQRYQGERLLLVGFAETATAIGEALAVQLGTDYMQTTREQIEGVEYLYFSESHSHATEQKVVKNDLDAVILGARDDNLPLAPAGCPGALPSAAMEAGPDAKPRFKARRIVFVEDEVTTGNTIWKIIQLIRQEYGEGLNFSVASLLNGMDGNAQARYRQNGIDLVYLVKTDHSKYPELAKRCKDDGIYHKCQPLPENLCQPSRKGLHQPFSGNPYYSSCESKDKADSPFPYKLGNVSQPSHENRDKPEEGIKEGYLYQEFSVSGHINARRLHKGAAYQEACGKLWQEIKGKIPFGAGQEILVLGTEEFMYAPLYVGQEIQKMGCRVKCHATTRSPILVSQGLAYPLHERYELVSLYDKGRVTYLYDLAVYDMVLVITDAEPELGRKDNFPEEYGQGIDGRRESATGKEKDFPEKCKGKIDALAEPGKASLCNAIYHSGSRDIYFVRWCRE